MYLGVFLYLILAGISFKNRLQPLVIIRSNLARPERNTYRFMKYGILAMNLSHTAKPV
jgi:hypothetical protein